jgi:PAS domain S-box-containing protein
MALVRPRRNSHLTAKPATSEAASALLPDWMGLLKMPGGAPLREQLEEGNFFRALVDALPHAIYATDAEGRIIFYNDAAAMLWGRRPQLGEDWWCGSWRLYWPDGTPMAHDQCPMAETLKTGKPVRGRRAIAERPDGTRFPFIPYPAPLFDEKGILIGAVNLLMDISERTMAERANYHLAAIVESSDDAIVSKNLDGIIQTWNKAAERMFGYRPDEIIGRPVLTLIPPDRHHEEEIILGRIRAGERIEHYETVRMRKDGSLIDVSLTVSPVKGADGGVIGASKIARDIGERKRAEATKELLLHEIKHRVKNTLSNVQAMASQTFRAGPREERQAFTARLQALAEAHDLLTQRDWQSAALDEVVARALKPFRDGRGQRIEAKGPPLVLGPNKALLIAMLLHELGTNAVKYGALSNAAGTVELDWRVEQRANVECLLLDWRERGGPKVEPPSRKGFGSRLIEHALKAERGDADLRYAPEGLSCTLSMALK